MAKRTWITVKRGILEPKHRFALGELIWLFMYILDITNWEAGTIEEWSDRGTSDEMDMPIATLVDQRRKLQEKGYITCERKQRGIRVIVHNWTNPREYTGKKYNEKVLVDTPVNTPVNTPINTPVIKDEPTNDVPSYNQKSKIKSQVSGAGFSDSRPVIETNYIYVWIAITGMSGIPASQSQKVIDAIDTLRPKFKDEKELIAYLTPYYEYWLTRKTKDGRAYSKSNCAWLYDLAIAGDPIPAAKAVPVVPAVMFRQPLADCEKCHGEGWYKGEIGGKTRRVECDCVKVQEEVNV